MYTAHIRIESRIFGPQVDVTVGRHRDDGARNQTQRHERKTEQQRTVADLIDHFQRRKKKSGLLGFLSFQSTLLAAA